MKKQLLKLGAACLALAVSANVMAQQQEATVYNVDGFEITLDGDLADWDGVPAVAIETVFQTETPSVDATWQMLWSDDGIYVAINAEDDIWMPDWLTSGADWQSDKIELYFDVTDPQQDGGGASAGAGNWQIAPYFSEDAMGVMQEADNGSQSCDWYDTEGGYIMEYYVPFSAIQTAAGEDIDPWVTTVIGFDVTLIDNDTGDDQRNRINWSNAGAIDESWNNMDDVGLITFSADPIAAINSQVAKNVQFLQSTVVTNELRFNQDVTDVQIMSITGSKVGTDMTKLAKGIYVAKVKLANGEAAAQTFLKK